MMSIRNYKKKRKYREKSPKFTKGRMYVYYVYVCTMEINEKSGSSKNSFFVNFIVKKFC